jgi:hypothetical protein
MIPTLIRIHDVNHLVATLEPVFDERKQHAILFVVAIEKCADMTYFTARALTPPGFRAASPSTPAKYLKGGVRAFTNNYDGD